MFGLAVLVVFGVFLLISFLVVRWAIGYARKNGKSTKRWGWGAAFVMYSLVFWDWIPTVAVHQSEAWSGVNPYAKPPKQEHWFEAWDGFLAGYCLRY